MKKKKMAGKSAVKSTIKPFVLIGSVASVVTIVALVSVIVVLLQRGSETESERIFVDQSVGGRGILVTEENLDQVLAQINRPVEDASYTVEMNSNWFFPSGKEESTNASVANSTDNNRTVYFDVILTGTSELVYSSPYLPVGSKLTNFALDAELERGTYPATVVYHLVDDDFKEITTLSVSVTLNIES